ncbi:MAG: fibro-slime domain-containing protein [Fibrobacter sp.]|nr:fibro-slime domain-containing protein [Fibrobacter sp.]
MKLFKTLFATLVAVGITSAWADLLKSDSSSEACSPIVHFKQPYNWYRTYVVIGDSVITAPVADENGWTTIDFSNKRIPNGSSFFFNASNRPDCLYNKCITSKGVKNKLMYASNEGFTCATFKTDGAEVWIQEHPDPKKTDEIYMTLQEPNVKTFYVFLPQNKYWMSATPIINEDGKEREMNVDPENCGWYFRSYVDEPLPASVVIRSDEDAVMEFAIGMNGAWEEDVATPIALDGLFEIYSTEPGYNKALYFVADAEESQKLPSSNQGWYVKRPDVIGKCSYELASMIYDTDASLHGAFTCAPNWNAAQTDEQALVNACFYPNVKYPVVTSDSAVMPCVGVTTGMVESTLDPKTKKMKLTSKGQKCFGAQADSAFAAMFSFTKGVNEQYCLDIPFSRTSDNKFEFNSDSYQTPGAKVPGGFYPAEEAPAAVMMVSERLPAAESKRKAEGPTFFTTDLYNTKTSSPLGLRTIHAAEGFPVHKLLCNGPGWDGGIDCEGLFVRGSEFSMNNELTDVGKTISQKFNVTWCGDGWGWSCPSDEPEGWHLYTEGTEKPASSGNRGTYRWTSTDGKDGDDSRILTDAGRNMHFCSETHAKFRFKQNLKFSISGNDDIWVFIDNKLAIDIGGSHLAAPGYVDLDKFMKNAEIGKVYDIDIFFCNRRTPTSNLDIKTNMYIEQGTAGITANPYKTQFPVTEKSFNLCYRKPQSGSCAPTVGSTEELICPPELKEPITYIFSMDKTGQDPTKTRYSADDFAANPKPYDGGIDVSNPYTPTINEYKLREKLPPGKYYLIIKIGTDQKAIEINIKGTIAVANREAVVIDENGNKSSPYAFKSQAMASQLKDDGTPDIDQMIPLYIAPMIDPCSLAANCEDPLEMQMAPNSDYSLQVSNPKAQFYAKKDGKLTAFNPTTRRTIGDGGIDTIYVTIPFDEMDVNAVETVLVNVSGSSRKAEIKFFVPRLVFVDSDSTYKIISEDKDSDIRLKGSAYDFYVVALNGDNTPCTECSFKLNLGSKTSAGLTIISGGEVVNGRATITVMSTRTYEADNTGNGYATLHVVGPSAAIMQAKYSKMQFTEPAVPIPVFADIFDVHGEKPKAEMDIPSKYFSMEQEYLDGIGDSIVVYYHRNFHKDSLPEKIAVFWENQKDSVVFDKDDVKNGAVCGSDAKLDKGICLPRITLGGKNLSKKVKTSGTGKIKSWATYTSRGVNVTTSYDGVIYDRIAPIIVSAQAITDTDAGKNIQLRITFSEPVQKTKVGEQNGDNIFSFYINASKEHHYEDYIPVLPGVAYGDKLDSIQTFVYDMNSTYPQAGDNIRIRSDKGVGLLTDQSEYAYAPNGDNIRPESDADYNWNYAPGYDATKRLPSPWVKITQGSAEEKDDGKKEEKVYAKPTFRVVMTAPFEFAIVLDESLPARAKQYAVLDMKGQVVSTGTLDNKDTRVKVQTTGSYVVKVGLGYRRVNVK